MVNSVFLVLAVLMASLPPPAFAAGKPPSIVFYERSAPGTIGPYNFTGSTTGPDIISFNTPFFYKLSDAESPTAMPDGRVVGFHSLETSSGTWAFEFFATKSWITTIFGFGTEGAPTNVVTGGTGCYRDEKGTVTNSIVPNTGFLFILEWTIFAP